MKLYTGWLAENGTHSPAATPKIFPIFVFAFVELTVCGWPTRGGATRRFTWQCRRLCLHRHRTIHRKYAKGAHSRCSYQAKWREGKKRPQQETAHKWAADTGIFICHGNANDWGERPTCSRIFVYYNTRANGLKACRVSVNCSSTQIASNAKEKMRHCQSRTWSPRLTRDDSCFIQMHLCLNIY